MRFVVVSLGAGAACLIFIPYANIISDARMYALQALASLHPDSLRHDVFLRFISQDSFSLFSTLVAPLVRCFGIDAVALSLTLMGEVAFLVACWHLTWTLTQRTLAAACAIAMLIVLPGHYGASGVFGLIEPFMTARPWAQVATIVALAAWAAQRRWLGIAALTFATAIHPLMATPGWVLLGCWWFVEQREMPRRLMAARWPWVAVAVVVGVLGLATWAAMASATLFFDASWLDQVKRRAPYLYLTSWRAEDWGGALVPLATLLAVAVRSTLPSIQRRFAVAAFGTGVLGLLLSMFAVDLFHVVLTTQGQPWRWLWLSTASGFLLLPELLSFCWRDGARGHTLALLLMAGWLARFEPVSLQISVLTAASTWASARSWGDDAAWRKARFGSAILVLLTMAYLSYVPGLARLMEPSVADRSSLDSFLLWLRSHKLVVFGVPVLALPWASSHLQHLWLAHRRAFAVPGAALLAATLALAAQAASALPLESYPRPLADRMSLWATMIPVRAEVMWLQEPEAVWLLMHRASYFSVAQTAAALFSPEAAKVLRQRAAALRAVTDIDDPLGLNSFTNAHFKTRSLSELCTTLDTDFVVTSENLDQPPVDALGGESGSFSGTRLYRCTPRSTAL